MTGLAVAFRELAVMFAAGVPLPRALQIEGRGAEGYLGQAFLQASQRISQGQRLSAALASYKPLFGELSLELLKVGEQTGSLQLVLNRIADYFERRNALELKLRASLTYPIFGFALCLLIIAILPSLLLGHLFELLGALGARPPLLTVVLMRLSSLLAHPLTWGLLGLAGLGAVRGLRQAWQRPALRLALEKRLLTAPLLGPTLRSARLSLFALALHTLYTAGMPMLLALRSAGRATGSLLFERAGEALATQVEEGASLAQALRREKLFPPSFTHLVAAGEEAGGLGRLLLRGAEMAQQEVEYRITVALAALEPLMLISMGVLVGVLVLATVSPILTAIESMAP